MDTVRSVEVEVLVDGNWFPGVLRTWSQRGDDGDWWAAVTYSTGPGCNRIDGFPADRVRQLVYCPWWQGHHECLGWAECGQARATTNAPPIT